VRQTAQDLHRMAQDELLPLGIDKCCNCLSLLPACRHKAGQVIASPSKQRTERPIARAKRRKTSRFAEVDAWPSRR